MAKEKTIQIQGEKLTIAKRQAHAKIDIPKALELRISGVSLEDIGKTQGVSKAAVCKALQPYNEHIERLKVYQGNKANLQDMVASRLLTEILNKDMEAEKLSSLGSCFDIMAKNYRLETGQSTSNVSIKVVDLTEFALNQDNGDS